MEKHCDNIILERCSPGSPGCQQGRNPTGWPAATTWAGSDRGWASNLSTRWTCSLSCSRAWPSPTRGRSWGCGTRTSLGRRRGTPQAVPVVPLGTRSVQGTQRGLPFKWNLPHHLMPPSQLQWSNEKNAGFSNGSSTWLPVNPNYLWLNLADQVATKKLGLWSTFRRCNKLYRAQVWD